MAAVQEQLRVGGALSPVPRTGPVETGQRGRGVTAPGGDHAEVPLGLGGEHLRPARRVQVPGPVQVGLGRRERPLVGVQQAAVVQQPRLPQVVTEPAQRWQRGRVRRQCLPELPGALQDQCPLGGEPHRG